LVLTERKGIGLDVLWVSRTCYWLEFSPRLVEALGLPSLFECATLGSCCILVLVFGSVVWVSALALYGCLGWLFVVFRVFPFLSALPVQAVPALSFTLFFLPICYRSPVPSSVGSLESWGSVDE